MTLETTAPQIKPAELADGVQALNDMATALRSLADGAGLSEKDDIDRAIAKLRQAARDLNAQIILIIADGATVNAQQINDALAHTKTVLKRVQKINDSLQLAQSVIGFLGAVLTGQASAIWKSARELRKKGDEFEKKYPPAAAPADPMPGA